MLLLYSLWSNRAALYNILAFRCEYYARLFRMTHLTSLRCHLQEYSSVGFITANTAL